MMSLLNEAAFSGSHSKQHSRHLTTVNESDWLSFMVSPKINEWLFRIYPTTHSQ